MRREFFWGAVAWALILAVSFEAQAQWTWTPPTGRWVNSKRLPKETPELQIEYARGLMLKGDYRQALRETEKFSDFYGKTELADQNQFLRGEILMAQRRYKEAAKEFQQVITGHPGTTLFDKVISKQYECGNLLYEKGQNNLQKHWRLFRKKPFRDAISVYTMVIDNQPFTNAAAEAQYKVGLCHYTREEYEDAAIEYRRVIEEYGSSDWVAEASYGLALCYYEDANPPAYDQAPSKLAVQAIDDFKARYPSDARVAELEEKRSEMRNTIADQRLAVAKFYEKRRRFDSARMYYKVVVDQFPETDAADEAREWLSSQPATGSPAAAAAQPGAAAPQGAQAGS